MITPWDVYCAKCGTVAATGIVTRVDAEKAMRQRCASCGHADSEAEIAGQLLKIDIDIAIDEFKSAVVGACVAGIGIGSVQFMESMAVNEAAKRAKLFDILLKGAA